MRLNTICEKKQLLIILALVFSQSVQAMTISGHNAGLFLFLGLSEVESQAVKTLCEFNRQMFADIDRQEIKEQFDDLFRAMPANINFTKQGTQRASTLQKSLPREESDDNANLEIRHKDLSQKAAISFGKLRLVTKEKFLSEFSTKLGIEKTS